MNGKTMVNHGMEWDITSFDPYWRKHVDSMGYLNDNSYLVGG
jgi:hypothetical protein